MEKKSLKITIKLRDGTKLSLGANEIYHEYINPKSHKEGCKKVLLDFAPVPDIDPKDIVDIKIK